MTEEVKPEVEVEVVVEVEEEPLIHHDNDEDIKEPEINWFEILQRIISVLLKNIATLVAIITAVGFVVLHVYMASFSSLFSYNVNLAQYIGAGLSLLIIPFILMEKALRFELPQFDALLIIIGFLLFTLSYIFGVIIHRKKWIAYNETSLYFKIIAFVFLIPVIIFLIYTYYPQVSRELGGGKPANVIITFNEDQPSNLWNFAINLEQPRLSEPLQLLIELNDGVLVRQAEGYNAVIVKNDVIYGIQDVSRTNPSPLPEPTASPTPSS